MKSHNVKHKPKFFKKNILITALCASLAVLGACSSSDDGDGVAGGDPTAFNFDASNSVIAAEIAAAAMSFFTGYTEVAQTVVATLTTSEPNNSPFDLMLCIGGGDSILSWADTDTSGTLSAGDTASLKFTNCDTDFSGETVTGSVDIIATSGVPNILGYTLGYTVDVNLTISLVPETTTILANFKATTSTPDLFNFTNVYMADDAPGQTLTVTENGTEYFKMGCFKVTHTFDAAGIVGGNYDLAAEGPINASNKIMSLAGGGPPLIFVNDDMHEETERLLSVAQPTCASIGSPGGVADSNGSYLDMEALGGGALRLHTYDVAGVETSRVDTTWEALTD